jgi:hypothetical protein
MGPIVAIPGIALVGLARAEKARRMLARAPFGYVVNPMPYAFQIVAVKAIHVANGTTRVRTIGGWLKRTGRR